MLLHYTCIDDNRQSVYVKEMIIITKMLVQCQYGKLHVIMKRIREKCKGLTSTIQKNSIGIDKIIMSFRIYFENKLRMLNLKVVFM